MDMLGSLLPIQIINGNGSVSLSANLLLMIE